MVTGLRHRSMLACAAASWIIGGTGCEVNTIEGYFAAIPKTAQPIAVCDGLSGGGQHMGAKNSGAVATLRYFPGNPGNSSADFYASQGTLAPALFFFNHIYVPTRDFARGFQTTEGTLVAGPDGSPLLEYFGLSIRSVLKLAPGDEDGNYQFATISDDGSVLRMETAPGAGLTTVVDADGQHSPRMFCSSSTVAMNAGSRVPLQLNYFQGPKVRIALILLWRRIPAGGSLSEEFCTNDSRRGQGDSFFFDGSQVPSEPQDPWEDIMGRGWKVIANGNLELPADAPPNPCAQ